MKDVKRANSITAKAVVLLVDGYRLSLGLALPSSCRFHPTCSCYLREAVERHGARCGLWLGLRRLMRCHPLHPGGYDPVPEINNKIAT